MSVTALKNALLLSKPGLGEAFSGLKKEYEIYGPCLKKGEGIYSDTDICVYDKLDSCEDLELKRRPYFSAKEIALNISEKLFDNTPEGLRQSASPSRKKIVFARACDIEGFKRLDKVYLENGPFVDPYYKSARQQLTFFLIECAEGFDGCFCQAMGADQTDDFGVSILEREDGLIVVNIKDEIFRKYFEVAAHDEAGQGDTVLPGRPACLQSGRPKQEEVVLPDFTRRELFESPLWNEYSKRCIGCGRCNMVCPTCSCFNVYDTSDEKGNIVRKRVWSGCQIDGFAKVAGGHEYRTDKGQRMRYKIMHKFHNFKERFGLQMCVGCGRCIEACPEFIDIRESLKRLNNG